MGEGGPRGINGDEVYAAPMQVRAEKKMTSELLSFSVQRTLDYLTTRWIIKSTIMAIVGVISIIPNRGTMRRSGARIGSVT